MPSNGKKTKAVTPRECMELAIKLALNCKPEDDRTHPKVGVVVVKDGKIVSTAYRGETGAGDHGEYAALDKKFPDSPFSGSTVYTTLEPCTKRVHPKKISCTQRLKDRHVKRVVIGMLDPNPDIQGKGQMALTEAGIEIGTFKNDLTKQILDINRDFIRQYRIKTDSNMIKADLKSQTAYNEKKIDLKPQTSKKAKRINLEKRITAPNITPYLKYDLDAAYQQINAIFWKRNLSRIPMEIFTHLVEVFGGLSQLASDKKKHGVTGESFIPKAFAWWMTLCGKFGVGSVAQMIWTKFPSICPYCYQCPHNQDDCSVNKAKKQGPDWTRLSRESKIHIKKKPTTLGGWQRMFAEIYPVSQTETSYAPAFARLGEELGELAEAVRTFESQPGYFLSEATDVFAWLMRIQNLLDYRNEATKATRGQGLEKAFYTAYPGICLDCGKPNCSCPMILDKTIGRIAAEAPYQDNGSGNGTNFMTTEQAKAFFQPRTLKKRT